MTKVKLAATIMLGREQAGQLEVLLVRRNKALAFAGGLWVFPGGKVEESELLAGENELSSAKLAAVRETKEEVNLDIDAGQLIFFRHWTTPINEPRRYATYFFFTDLPAMASEVMIDDSEIKAYQWLSPQDALNQLAEGKLGMMPPTVLSLQLIRKCKTIQEVRELLSSVPPIFVLPTLHLVDGTMVCMFEGDAGFMVGDATIEGPRHRLNLNITTGAFDFEFYGCEGVVPVNGDMHL